MLRLMLLRHAKSDWPRSGGRDHERPLNARGREAAPLVGRYMTAHDLLPQHAIVSTAARTRETWSLVQQTLRARPTTEFDSRIYEASPHVILDAIMRSATPARQLIVVGHNPGLQSLALALVGAGECEARARLFEKFPTGGLAVIDFDAAAWSDIRPGTGRLVCFVTPQALADADK